ncbi:DUF4097 family beta strand repeat-containing protein [Litchfieldia alkalitelluris]|uniref:DUF4097 family beta strand repeat-containing protein n=1 Tax=Litchfieldia alkalitelluris TaxID=304268 RepID=UPI0009964410|nr:DUF4097 domain-containing protein [Litchfieldia alkalitelluris]
MSEERKRILKLVEEGKLNANEALTLLEALEAKQTNQSTFESESNVHEVSTQVEKGKQNTHEQKNHSYKQSSVKSKLVDFIDSAVKKIKDLDLDFNFGNGVEVNHIFQHSDVLLKQIDLDVANGSVDIIPWNENDVRIECEAKVYKLDTTEAARSTFLQDVIFSIEGGKLRFSVQKKQMKVVAKVFVPSEQYEHVKVRMFNGPISGEGLNVKHFKGKTANGSIKFSKLASTSVELETANGHIELNDCFTKECELETINGTINVTGSMEKLDVQSFNGNVICRLIDDQCHTLQVRTTTGNVDIFTPTTRPIDGELKSNLGGFSCEIPHMNIVEEKSEVVQKYMRFKTKPGEGQGEKLYIFADTKTGSVIIKPNDVR